MYNVKGCNSEKWHNVTSSTEPQRSHTIKELIYRYQRGLPLPRCANMRYDSDEELDDDDNMSDEPENYTDITQIQEASFELEGRRKKREIIAREKKKKQPKMDIVVETKKPDETDKNVEENQE